MDREALRYLSAWLARIRDDVPVDSAILFGSRAGDDYLQTSDLDILVVSRAFEGIPWPDRPKRLHLLWDGPWDPEFLCYTPEEFERKRRQVGIVRTGVEEGVEVPA